MRYALELTIEELATVRDALAYQANGAYRWQEEIDRVDAIRARLMPLIRLAVQDAESLGRPVPKRLQPVAGPSQTSNPEENR